MFYGNTPFLRSIVTVSVCQQSSHEAYKEAHAS